MLSALNNSASSISDHLRSRWNSVASSSQGLGVTYQSICIGTINTEQRYRRFCICRRRRSVCSDSCSRGCSAGSGEGWPHQPGGHHFEGCKGWTGIQARKVDGRELGERRVESVSFRNFGASIDDEVWELVNRKSH
jgi:hypothetical protein